MGNISRIVVLLAWISVVVGTVTWKEDDQHVVVQNGYTLLSFNKLTNAIDQISADFSGAGAFVNNNLAEPFALKVELSSTNGTKSCANEKNLKTTHTPTKTEWLSKSDKLVSFRVSNIRDHSLCKAVKSTEDSIASEEWIITLAENMRSATVDIRGEILQDSSVEYILHGIYSNSPSLYGLFPKGVSQMMGNNMACMGSAQPLSRAYVLGDGAAMDIVRHKYGSQHVLDDSDSDTTLQNAQKAHSTVVFRSAHETFASGIEDVLFGTYPSTSGQMTSAWKKTCWNNTTRVTVTKGTTWEFGLTFIPNNYDFPPYLLNNVTATPYTVPFQQLRAYLTGIYASPVGCLQSYYDLQFGTIAPTISHPDVGYSPDTNFFDPDNFISLSAMMYSGDAYLLRQVKYVLSRTAETMCGIGKEQVDWYCNPPIPAAAEGVATLQSAMEGAKQNVSHPAPRGRKHKLFSTKRFNYSASSTADTNNTRTGQLMHHFVSLVPTYESIAGSEQLGPNIFWTFSVLRYIALTQDSAFAAFIFPFVDLSTKYVLTFFDADKGLFRAPGPLWIDVIVRENYTSDSNGMLVPYLQKVADFYDFMQVDADFATSLRELSETVAANIRNQLFNTRTNDHFITQLNPDGSIRDFVDYDSNLMTVAFGIITDPAQIKRVLNRVDSGPYTHVRGTWCSEVPYSGDAMDCYIVGGTVCGDSVVTLARIGWVDALARKRVGDLQTFQELLLEPLQNDLLRDVWLYERYNATGQQIRTPYYFEYPSLVTMMLREVQYGIDITVNSVTIDPFPHKAYDLTLGAVSVSYSPNVVTLVLPGVLSEATTKMVTLGGMSEGTYDVEQHCTTSAPNYVTTTAIKGVVKFQMKFASECTVTAVRQKCSAVGEGNCKQ